MAKVKEIIKKPRYTTVCRLCHAKKNTEEIKQCICTSKSFFVTDHKKLTCRDYICE